MVSYESPLKVLSMKIFGLLMVVVKLTLVESSKSVNLVSAGRVGGRLRSMDNLIVGGRHLNLSPHRCQIRSD